MLTHASLPLLLNVEERELCMPELFAVHRHTLVYLAVRPFSITMLVERGRGGI